MKPLLTISIILLVGFGAGCTSNSRLIVGQITNRVDKDIAWYDIAKVIDCAKTAIHKQKEIECQVYDYAEIRYDPDKKLIIMAFWNSNNQNGQAVFINSEYHVEKTIPVLCD